VNMPRTVFRAALLAFPRRVREVMMDEATAAFQLVYAVRRRQGLLPALRYLLLAATDAVRAGVRERIGRPREQVSHDPMSRGDRRSRTLYGSQLALDVREATRLYRRRPLVAACVVVVIAIGVAATTSVFSVVDGVLLQPLPWYEPERVVWLQVTRGTETPGMANPLDVADWKDRARTLSDVAAVGTYEATLQADGTMRIAVAEVSQGFGNVLGVRALHGRLLAEEDYARGVRSVVVSYDLWRDHLGADPAAVGRSILLDQRPYTVVGVLPDLPVRFPLDRAGVWTAGGLPAPGDDSALSRSGVWLWALARLAPGVEPDAAAAELHGIAAALRQQFPESNRERGVNTVPVRDLIVGPIRPVLLLLAGAVALVLLVAAANVGNLLLAVAHGRRQELAIRATLGAARPRLARQIFTESLLLALIGAAVGLAFAPAALRALLANYPGGLPRADEVGVHVPALVVAMGAMLVAAVGGALPTLHQLRRRELWPSMRSGERSGHTRGDQRLRSALVTAQVALSIVLLFAGAVLWRSFDHLNRTEIGFTAENLLTFNMALSSTGYRSPAEEFALHAEVLERVRALPGVRAAGTSTLLPFAPGEFIDGFARVGHPEDVLPDLPSVRLQNVTPGFIEALGLQLVAGRAIDASDGEGGTPVVVVNREAERAYFPDGALGRQIEFRGARRRIVGVVSDKRHRNVRTPPMPELYVPKSQSDYPRLLAWVAVRTDAGPLAVMPAVRRIVDELDPTVSLDDIRTMDARLGSTLAPDRFRTILVTALSAAAMLLALLGLWGVVGYTVARQSREIGIRMALGESPAGALRRVLLDALRIAGVGALIGVLVALAGARLLEGFVAGVQARDLPTLLMAASSFLLAAALAALEPARRASAVAPGTSIRQD
jgi:putative ABC transport system permease protein